MKIGVLAGTPVDTQMGMEYIISKGHTAIGRACSPSPEKQNELQILYKEELFDLAVKLCLELEKDGAEGIFVNCNSLSGAIDMHLVEKSLKIPLVTPLDVYSQCAKKYSVLGIIAANGQSMCGIEKVILTSNPSCTVCGCGLLPVVSAIENGKDPQDIYEEFKLKLLMESLEAFKIDALILGCTHFPYLLPQLKNNTNTTIINPSKNMLEILLEKTAL